MGLKEAYLKIEDKWFDFLDFLDDKGIPVYTLIDPLEKNGIPSMPVYLTLLVAIVAGIFFFSSGGSGFSLSGGVPVNLQLTNVLNESIPGTLSILDMQGNLVRTLSSDNGSFNLKLKNGDYYLTFNSSNCTALENQFIEISGEPVNKNFSLECQGLSLRSDVSFCFTPEQTGKIQITGYENGLPVSSDECSASDCRANLANDGRSYKFSKGNLESQLFTFNDLLGYMNSQDNCIPLNEKVKEPKPMEKVVLKIEDQQGQVVKFADVQLVNPEDDESVLQEQLTNDKGVAVFKEVELGTKFQVKILGTENTTTYLHDVVYTVPHGGLIETIKINRSASSKVQVQIQKEIGLDYAKGALISLIDEDSGKVENTKQANSTGEVVFGVEKNKEYTIGIWYRDYGYIERNLIGGEDLSVIMNMTQEKGNIQASVFLEDEPLAGVKLTLYDSEKKEVGIPVAVTNTQGQTAFYDVPAGDYCIIAHRNIGGPSDCKDVTVNPNETTNVEIDLQKLKFSYLFHVQKQVKEGNSTSFVGLKNAEVNIYEAENTSGEKVASGTTDRYGNVKLELPEELVPLVSVNYNEGQIKYITEETLGEVKENSSVNITVKKLALEAHLMGVMDNNNKMLNLSSDKIAADSNSYYAVISIGLPNYKGKKWDKVSFTISSESGAVEFYQGSDANRNGFKPTQGNELLITRTFELTSYKLGNESKDGKTVIVKIPFIVKSTSLGNDSEKKLTLDLKTTWTSGSDEFNYPEQGSEQLNFNASREKCGMIGSFLVCSTISTGGRSLNPFASSSLNVGLGKKVQLVYEIINEQESEFNGDVLLTDTEQGLKPNSLTAYVGGKELSQYTDISYDKDTGTTTIHVNGLKPFEKMSIIANMTAIKPPTSIMQLTIGSDSKDLYSISIQGQDTPIFVLTEPSNGLFDLTNSMTFYLKSNLTGDKIPVTWYLSSTRIKNLEGGELAISTYDPSHSYVDLNDNTITINFDENYHLKGGSYVEITANGDYVNRLDKKILVSNCIESPGTPISFFADMKGPCEVDFTTADSVSAGLSDTSTGYCGEGNNYQVQFKNNCGADIKLNQPIIDTQRQSKTAPKGGQLINDESSFTFDSGQYNNGVTSYAGNEFSVPINITVTFTNGELSVTYPINFTLIEIKNDPQQPAKDGVPFTPLKTASLSNPTCDENNYCTLEQFGNYLKERIGNMQETNMMIRTNLLVDTSNPAVGAVNINEFKNMLSWAFNKKVEIVTSSSIPTPQENYLYLLKNGFPPAGIQGGVITLTIKKSLNEQNKPYYVVTQISSNSIPPSIGNTVVYAQLEMPYYTKTPSNPKFQIEAINDSSTPMPGLNAYIKKLFAAMYSKKENNIHINLKKPNEAKASNLIHFAICNDDKDIDYNDVCGKFNIFTNRDKYDAIVFKSVDNQDEKQNGVYFIARSNKFLDKIINATANAINKTNHGEQTQDLYLNTRNVCLDTNGLLTEVDEGGECPNPISTVFLSLPSNKVKVFCADESLGCSDLKDNKDSKVAKALIDYFSQQRGVSPNEIELVNKNKLTDSQGDFTSDVVITSKEVLDSDDYKDIKNYLITVINQQGSTVFGIPDYYLIKYSDNQPTLFVIIPNEDNITTIFQDKGFINITGLDLTKLIVRTMKGEDTGLAGKTIAVNLVKDNCSVTGALQDFGISTYNRNKNTAHQLDMDILSTINKRECKKISFFFISINSCKPNKIAYSKTGKFLIKIDKEDNRVYSMYLGDLTAYFEHYLFDVMGGSASVFQELRKAPNCALGKASSIFITENMSLDTDASYPYTLTNERTLQSASQKYGDRFPTPHICNYYLTNDNIQSPGDGATDTSTFKTACDNAQAGSVDYNKPCKFEQDDTAWTFSYCTADSETCGIDGDSIGCCPAGFNKYNATEGWCEKQEQSNNKLLQEGKSFVNTYRCEGENTNCEEYSDGKYQNGLSISGGVECGATDKRHFYCSSSQTCAEESKDDSYPYLPGKCCPSNYPIYNASYGVCCPAGAVYNPSEGKCEGGTKVSEEEQQRDYVPAVEGCTMQPCTMHNCCKDSSGNIFMINSYSDPSSAKCGDNTKTKGDWDQEYDAYCREGQTCAVPWDGSNKPLCCPSDHPNYDESKGECY